MDINPYASKPKKNTPLVSNLPIETSYQIPTPVENTLYSFGRTHNHNLMVTPPYNNTAVNIGLGNTQTTPIVNLHSEFIHNYLFVDKRLKMFQGISFGFIQILNEYQHNGPDLFEVNIEADDQEVAVQLETLPNNKIVVNIVYFHKHLQSKWFVKHTVTKEQEGSLFKRYKPMLSMGDTNTTENTTQRNIHSEFITRHLAVHKSNSFIPPIPFGLKHILNNYCHEGPTLFDINVEDANEEFAIQFQPLPNNNTKISIVHLYKRLKPEWSFKHTNITKEESCIENNISETRH
jgi:hypothetical protein